MPRSEAILGDCMQYMRTVPDKYFELAIVDVNYGIGESSKDEGRNGYGIYTKKKAYESKDWDKKSPKKDYFDELLRVSVNQIVWGANHFISKIPYDSSCWIVWDKDNNDNDFADCELAWASFKTAVRRFKFRWNGMLQENMRDKEQRIHPTQKPVALYKWLLRNYAKEGDKIFDSHMGSQSSRIACYDGGFDFVGCELDEDYFRDGCKRFEDHIRQLKLF